MELPETLVWATPEAVAAARMAKAAAAEAAALLCLEQEEMEELGLTQRVGLLDLEDLVMEAEAEAAAAALEAAEETAALEPLE